MTTPKLRIWYHSALNTFKTAILGWGSSQKYFKCIDIFCFRFIFKVKCNTMELFSRIAYYNPNLLVGFGVKPPTYFSHSAFAN